jgi:fatty-acyl-CoA synthase
VSERAKPWVDGTTIGKALAETAARFPDRDALVFPHLSYRLSYAAFRAEVEQVARGLLALGVRKGENVGIWSTNWPQWVLLQFAAAEIGAVFVNVNPAYRAHEQE